MKPFIWVWSGQRKSDYKDPSHTFDKKMLNFQKMPPSEGLWYTSAFKFEIELLNYNLLLACMQLDNRGY